MARRWASHVTKLLFVTSMFLAIASADYGLWTGFADPISFSPNGRYVCLQAGPEVAPFLDTATTVIYDRQTYSWRPVAVLPSGRLVPNIFFDCQVDDSGTLAFFDLNIPQSLYHTDPTSGVFVRNLEQRMTHQIPSPDGSSPPFRVRQFVNGSLAVFSDAADRFYYASLNNNGSFASWLSIPSSWGYVAVDLSHSVSVTIGPSNDAIVVRNSSGDVIAAPSAGLENSRLMARSSSATAFLLHDPGLSSFLVMTISAGSVAFSPPTSIFDLINARRGSVSDDGTQFSIRGARWRDVRIFFWSCSLDSGSWACSLPFAPGGAATSSQGDRFLVYPTMYLNVISLRNGSSEQVRVQSCIYETAEICTLRNEMLGVFDGSPDVPSKDLLPASNNDGTIVVFFAASGAVLVRNMTSGQYLNFSWHDGSPFQAAVFVRYPRPIFSANGNRVLIFAQVDPNCDQRFHVVLDVTTRRALSLPRDGGRCGYFDMFYPSIAHDGSWVMGYSTTINGTQRGFYLVDLEANQTVLISPQGFTVDISSGYLFNNRSMMLVSLADDSFYVIDFLLSQSRRLAYNYTDAIEYGPRQSGFFVSLDEKTAAWVRDGRITFLDLESNHIQQSSDSGLGLLSSDLSSSVDLQYWALLAADHRLIIYDRFNDTFSDGYRGIFYLYPLPSGAVLSGDGSRILFPTSRRLIQYDINAKSDVYSCDRQLTDCIIVSVSQNWNPPAPPQTVVPVAQPVAAPVIPPDASPSGAPAVNVPSQTIPSSPTAPPAAAGAAPVSVPISTPVAAVVSTGWNLYENVFHVVAFSTSIMVFFGYV